MPANTKRSTQHFVDFDNFGKFKIRRLSNKPLLFLLVLVFEDNSSTKR